MPKIKPISPTQWGEIASRVKALGIKHAEYHHVHVCNANPEGRDCSFQWELHNITSDKGDCDCFPKIDFSDVRQGVNGDATQIVFIVHQGAC